MGRRRQPRILDRDDLADCDRIIRVVLSEVFAPKSAAKRLRIATGLLRALPALQDERDKSIQELHDAGQGWRVIGEVFGVQGSTARDHVTRHRIFPDLS